MTYFMKYEMARQVKEQSGVTSYCTITIVSLPGKVSIGTVVEWTTHGRKRNSA